MILTDNPTLSAIYSRVCDLRAATGKELVERELVVKESDEYSKLGKLIEDLQARLEDLRGQQDALLSKVPDSRGALMEAERDLFEAMKADGRMEFANAKMKYSESNSVNKARLLEKAGGDLDLILDLATFTIKGIKEFAKTADKSFLDCIETTYTPSGIEFTS